MRRFDSQEIAWLECLVLVARIGPISAPAFLARLHFSRAAGRATSISRAISAFSARFSAESMGPEQPRAKADATTARAQDVRQVDSFIESPLICGHNCPGADRLGLRKLAP